MVKSSLVRQPMEGRSCAAVWRIAICLLPVMYGFPAESQERRLRNKANFGGLEAYTTGKEAKSDCRFIFERQEGNNECLTLALQRGLCAVV